MFLHLIKEQPIPGFEHRLIYQVSNKEPAKEPNMQKYTEKVRDLAYTREELKEEVQNKMIDITKEHQLIKDAVNKLKAKINNGEKGDAIENFQCFGKSIQVIMKPDYTYQTFINENGQLRSIEFLPWAIDQNNQKKNAASQS